MLRSAMDLDEKVLHFNNAGVAPTTRAARTAAIQCAEQMALGGMERVNALLAAYSGTREVFADLVGCPRQNLGMMQTCAAAISQAAFGIPLKAGDEILRWDQEYPSNAYPWHAAAERAGATVRVVESESDYRVDTQRFIDAITEKTRVVAVSWIQFQTGAETDLRPLTEAAHRVGAWVVVDAIQGLGVIPFSMTEVGVDIVCGGTHKWLLGPLGHGFIGVAEGRLEELTPVLHGAMTYGTPDDPVEVGRGYRSGAKRFEPGNPLLFGALAGAASLRVFAEVGGVEAIHGEALRLRTRLREGLLAQGHTLLSSEESRSPITTFKVRGDLKKAVQILNQGAVAFAERGGGIRIAPHAYNTDDDIDRLLELLGGAP
jgi:selenocysteine lyase/cysteine desulfurase